MHRFECLSEFRGQDAQVLFIRQTQESFSGFVPIVQGQIECAPMNRKERPAAEHFECFEGIFGAQVNIAPTMMKCADLEHDQVERPVMCADGLELIGEPRIAGKEDLVPIRLNDPGRP